MTASEFKTRLANGDKLAVVMFELAQRTRAGLTPDGFTRLLEYTRDYYEDKASGILAALASAEAKRK